MRKLILIAAVLLTLLGCASMNPVPFNPEPFATPHKLTSQLELISFGAGIWSVDGSTWVLKGIVHNISGKTLSYIEIDINYFDASGNQYQTSFVNTTDLAADDRWSFQDVIPLGQGCSWQIVGVKHQSPM